MSWWFIDFDWSYDRALYTTERLRNHLLLAIGTLLHRSLLLLVGACWLHPVLDSGVGLHTVQLLGFRALHLHLLHLLIGSGIVRHSLQLQILVNQQLLSRKFLFLPFCLFFYYWLSCLRSLLTNKILWRGLLFLLVLRNWILSMLLTGLIVLIILFCWVSLLLNNWDFYTQELASKSQTFVMF